jgi:hypothetical protein
MPTPCRLEVECLEDRRLPSAATVLGALHDPGVRSLALADFHRHHALTRLDMIGLFRAVASDGKVSATELSDLRALAGHGSDLGMTPAVQDLAGKVVGFNPANEHYRGQAFLATGQIQPGQTGPQLTALVDKWFLGSDLPSTQIVIGQGTLAAYPYQAAAGKLFGTGGPSYQDIGQGKLGDCYFLAALGELALDSPQSLKTMFNDNGDGTYTVRFFHQVGTHQVPDYVTVNRKLPVSGGYLIFAGGADAFQPINSPTNVLWVALAEKAYAQVAEEGWSRPGQAVNAYQSIVSGFAQPALQQLLGEPTGQVVGTGPGGYLAPADVATLVLDVQAGKMVCLVTPRPDGNRYFTGTTVVEGHEYYLKGYDPATGLFTLVNPWGFDKHDGSLFVGTLQLAAWQFPAYFDVFDVAAPHIAWH